MGLSSMSSSRLTLDATLESALMTFEADTVVLPSKLDEMPVSSDELGVTRMGQSEHYFIETYVDSASRHLRLPALGLLFVALGVLLLCPRELDVESGISSEGSSQP